MIVVLAVVAAVLLGSSFCMLHSTDNEAIEVVKSQSDKLNIKYRSQLSVKRKGIVETFLLGTDVIQVIIPEDKEFFAYVSRRNMEVTTLYNPESMVSALNKIGIKYNKMWPPFLNNDKSEIFINENQAKKNLLEYAIKIGLPIDVQPQNFRLISLVAFGLPNG